MLSHERFENVAVNENFMIDWPLNRLVFMQNFKTIGHLLWLKPWNKNKTENGHVKTPPGSVKSNIYFISGQSIKIKY